MTTLNLSLLAEPDFLRDCWEFLSREDRDYLVTALPPDTLLEMCRSDLAFFVDNFCQIEDTVAKGWIPFRLWEGQKPALQTVHLEKLVVILKARQIGLTWLVLAYGLWLVLFHPVATVLLFSLREKDAESLLWAKMRGIYDHLPEWMKLGKHKLANNSEWILSNGSTVRAFPTTGGRSYTATMALIDEADYVPNLQIMLNAIKPTIDAGGQLFLLSTSDKRQSDSDFKRIYRAAESGEGGYKPIFLPWSVRPDRTQQWYDQECVDALDRDGALDYIWQEYPSTAAQSLAPNSLDKRIHPAWLEQCYVEMDTLKDLPPDAPSIPGLKVYRLPEKWHQYVVSGDSALGKEKSDDSASHVLDITTGEEVACLVCKMEPKVQAVNIGSLVHWYNNAGVMVERNSMGIAVLGHLEELGVAWCLDGHDGAKGWLSTELGKNLLYNHAANAFRNREVILHTFRTYTQLSSIEKATLRAPKNLPDDESDSFALCLAGRLVMAQGTQFIVVQRDQERPRGQFGSWVRPRESGGSQKPWEH